MCRLLLAFFNLKQFDNVSCIINHKYDSLGEETSNTFSFEVKERKLTHLRIEELQTSLVGSNLQTSLYHV